MQPDLNWKFIGPTVVPAIQYITDITSTATLDARHHRHFDRNSPTELRDCVLDDGIYVYMWYVLQVGAVPISHSPPSIPLISPRMVNYHDPVVVAQDYSAYASAAKHTNSWSQLTSFDSGIIEALAWHGWTLLVCLPCRSCPILS